MNIGLFTDTYFPQINGVATSVHVLADSLRKRGNTVYIFAPYAPHEDETEDYIIRMPSMPCILVKNFRLGLLYSPLELKRIVSDLKLDIVHTQTEFSLGIFGRTLAKTLHVPIVHTYHTMYVDYVHYIINGALISPSMAKSFSRVCCNGANAVIAPTIKVKNSLIEYGVTKPIEIIPTGIDLKMFKKETFDKEEIYNIKYELGISKEDKVILSLGRLAQEKSVDIIIKSMPRVLEKIKNVKLLIVGDGPSRKELEELTQNLNLSENIIFAGAKVWEEIGKYYQLGDVFVSASTSETQGLTFAEAMAGGIPVVAKNDECIENLVIHEKTGFLFNDEKELPDYLYEILNNDKKREEFSKESILSADNISVEKFAENVENLYKDIFENPLNYGFDPEHSLSPLFLTNKTMKKIKKTFIRQGRKATVIAKLSSKKIKRFYKNIEKQNKQ